MPDSGDLPHKPHSHRSAQDGLSRLERTRRDQAIAHQQVSAQSRLSSDRGDSRSANLSPRRERSPGNGQTRRKRLTLWQLLFGDRPQATGTNSDKSVVLQVKQASFALSEPSTEVMRSFRSNRKRVDAALGKANLASAQDAKRRTGFGRSRLGRGTRLTTKGKLITASDSATPKEPLRPLRASPPTTLQARALTVLQSNQPTVREQAEQLAHRRAARGRTNSRLSTNETVLEKPNALPRDRQRKQSLPDSAQPPVKSRSAAPGRRDRPRRQGANFALYAARMLILSVGIGVLAGTLLSAWDPTNRLPTGASRQPKQAGVVASNTNPSIASAQLLKLGQEIAPLKTAIQTVSLQSPQVAPGVFLLDLDANSYIDLNGSAVLSAASTIKVPVLVALFQDVDAGKVRLDELLTMQREMIASGSGDMQYQPAGTQFTVLETITKMITISDNTATNMVIARLGGIAALNQRFKSWNLNSTAINNLLPDLEGTNTTSAKDMALLMARISQGDFMSLRSRDRMLEIMHKTVTDSLLPRGLGEGATIAHKTGDIGTMVGDVGLIDLPNGKRYAAAVLVKRSFNDERAQELIRQISQLAYQHFNRSQTPSTRSASPPAASTEPNAGPSPRSEDSRNATNAAT